MLVNKRMPEAISTLLNLLAKKNPKMRSEDLAALIILMTLIILPHRSQGM